jgi:hypothetical protein
MMGADDDYASGDMYIPLYFIEFSPGKGNIRPLKEVDFSLIDQGFLNKSFKESGRGDCSLCPHQSTNVPYMNVMILSFKDDSNRFTIAGYERRGYSTFQWLFAFSVFFLLVPYCLLILTLAWIYFLNDIASAFVGLSPQEDWGFIFPKRSTVALDASGDKVFPLGMALILGFPLLGIAVAVLSYF